MINMPVFYNRIIEVSQNDDWNKLIEKFQDADIYHSKEYTNLFAKVEEGIPQAVYFENENGKVFYPFIKRKIDIKVGYFDIITAYGYGGPIYEGDKKVIKQFYDKFKDHCFQNNIVTETIGLHPLLKNAEDLKEIMIVDYIRKTTAVDLTLPLEDIRKSYKSNNRRNIRKSKKEGVKVFISNEKEDIEIFMELYYETMDRKNASSFYYFNKSYFYDQMEETVVGKPYLLLAKYNEEIIGGVIMLVGKQFAHYHLGASKTKYLALRPNNILFDAMVEYAKSLGLKSLHLGGGYIENDNLFKFKTSFTNNNNFDYFLGKNIINIKVYNELLQKIIKNQPAGIQDSYFPLYRSRKIAFDFSLNLYITFSTFGSYLAV
ncbi:lipid II:glycine glycyltransferase FemX [Peribacillus glennii]|uniref:Lipid II:glycine glycyltransferase n=1 Tax=Peribacillus glennii TaxID=2303991 RepID=A0A372LER9_9BACI|nr:GNAT family N-acetyltransferase [Peribacillus glennii]RFU64737.1 GNAT family N-acetyltransferase [Peribacillus glennii]